MIPYHSELSDFNLNTQPDNTFFMDFERNTITGNINGLTASAQAARLILDTERYGYIIYSYLYGTEIAGLFGRPANYACSELKRRITEALKQDDRIKEVSDFSFEPKKGTIKVAFIVHTIFGELQMEKEIEI